jgi:hypothetical protein
MVSFCTRTGMTYEEKQAHMNNMDAKMMNQQKVSVNEADKLALARPVTRYILKNHPDAFTEVRNLLLNLEFNDTFEFNMNPDMEALMVDAENMSVQENDRLKNKSNASEFFYKNKMLFLKNLERLDIVYQTLNSAQNEN